jgi:hypothetical protein
MGHLLMVLLLLWQHGLLPALLPLQLLCPPIG